MGERKKERERGWKREKVKNKESKRRGEKGRESENRLEREKESAEEYKYSATLSNMVSFVHKIHAHR